MPNRKQTIVSDFYCTQCGNKGIPIARKVGSQREAGHLKKLYCMYCQEEVNHVEIRPYGQYNYEDFKREFELGRFVHGNRVPINECISCSKTTCDYNVSGKCWNCNGNFNCEHRLLAEVGLDEA